MIDKSLVLGTLPMQPYSAFTGLGVFRLPLGVCFCLNSSDFLGGAKTE